MEMIGHQAHAQKVLTVQNKIREKKGKYVLRREGSNTLRNGSYKVGKEEVNLSHFQSLIDWNAAENWILVEPKISFDALCRFTLKKGFVCPVVPEFKTITVGGAIMGAALESSSHKWGQVSDVAIEYEVILGNGDLFVVSANKNADLFFALPGSYGTLALLTAIKLKLVIAKKWVHLTYHRFHDVHAMVNHLTRPVESDFIEGIIFTSSSGCVIHGEMSHIPLSSPLSFSRSWSPWYIQHVATTQKTGESLPLYDYLFRFDRGAFWMGKYIHSVRSMLQLIFQWGIPEVKNSSINPNFIFRLLFGWFLSSQKLYQLWHRVPNKISENLFLIHDFYAPFPEAESALRYFIEKTDIFPIWLCPVKGHSEHFLSPSYGQNYFLNIGLYGVPKTKPIPPLSAQLEQAILQYGGRKMLYSFTYYDPKVFNQVYHIEKYNQLRKKYHAEPFLTLYDKVAREFRLPE